MSTLAERLISARHAYRDAGRVIRRARRLYLFLVWPAIKADPTEATMLHCIQRMRQSGMYASLRGERDMRYTILRAGWKRETGAPSRFGHPDGWHFWYRRNGYACHSWERITEKIA